MKEKNNKSWIWVAAAVAVLLIVLLLLTRCGEKAPDWQEQYDLGLRYLSEGNYEEAILAFSAAIEIDPQRAEAYLARGDAYQAMGDPESAQKDYEKAAQLDPGNREAEEKLEELQEQEEIQELPEKPALEVPPEKRLVRVGVYDRNTDVLKYENIFEYNAAGLITREDTRHMDEAGNVTSAYTETFTYDSENRIQLVYYGDQSIPTFEYHYNDAGQCTGYTFSNEMEYGVVSVQEIAMAYDSQGRLIRSEEVDGWKTTEYAYNEAGNLILSSTEDSLYFYTEYESYVYDETGQLIEKTVTYSNTDTRTVYRYEYPYLLLTLETCASGQFSDELWLYDADGRPVWCADCEDARFVTDEYGYLIQMIQGDSVYELEYELVEEGTDDSAEYEIQRRDQSYYDENGTLRVSYYYDQIVLMGDRAEYGMINGDIQKHADTVLSEISREDLMASAEIMAGEDYLFYTNTAEVTQNSGGVFSFVITMDWFMGGVYNRDYYGYTYDLRSGTSVNLAELFHMEEAQMAEQLKNRAWEYLSANHAGDLFDDARQVLYDYTLEDFIYYIRNGELILTFPTYALGFGASGAFTVPTGLYLN